MGGRAGGHFPRGARSGWERGQGQRRLQRLHAEAPRPVRRALGPTWLALGLVWSAALLLNSVYLQTQIRSLGACQHDRVGLAFFLFLCVCEDAKCLTHTGVTQPAAGVGGTYTGGGAFRQGGGAPGWAGLQGSCSALSQVVDQRRPAPFSAGKPWPGSLQDHPLAGQGSGGSSPHTPLVGSDTVSRFCDTELILAFDIGHRSQGWVSKLSFYFAEGH